MSGGVARITENDGSFQIPLPEGGLFHIAVKQFGRELYKGQIEVTSDVDMGIIKVDNSINLDEILIVGNRKIIEQKADRVVYHVANDPFTQHMDVTDILKRAPSLVVRDGDKIEMLGKSEVRYMINGKVMEMPEEAVNMQLKSLKSEDIEKIEVLSIPPSKYSADKNYGFVHIITRKDETLGFKANAHLRVYRNDNTSESGGLTLKNELGNRRRLYSH
jgi:hypothetical protein